MDGQSPSIRTGDGEEVKGKGERMKLKIFISSVQS